MDDDLVLLDAKLDEKNRLYITKNLRKLFESQIGLFVGFRLDEKNSILYLQKRNSLDLMCAQIKRIKGRSCARLQLPTCVINSLKKTNTQNDFVLIIESKKSSCVTFRITHKDLLMCN